MASADFHWNDASRSEPRHEVRQVPPSRELGGLRVIGAGIAAAQPEVRVLNGRRLAEARVQLRLSQSRFAEEVNLAAHELGFATRCTKRLVQKWEKGVHACPLACYQSAIERVTGRPFESFMEPEIVPDYAALNRRVNEIAITLAFLVKQLDDVANQLRFAEI